MLVIPTLCDFLASLENITGNYSDYRYILFVTYLKKITLFPIWRKSENIKN